MIPLFAKGKRIMELFDVGETSLRKCRRFIADHPERYGRYGNNRTLTSTAAFVDAYKYCDFDADDLPPFEPREALRLMEQDIWD